ncbi:MAG: hypothetical protein H7833_11260 [Magnetococcus sp. DMHC-1]|nr:hypothetical protein [Magnetococcales bacterium]
MNAHPSPTHRPNPLSGWTIAISISESPDLALSGLQPIHLELAMQEMARYLLAQGADLAYGGDLRPGGFTEQLFQLVATYRRKDDHDDVRRIHNYLAWPIHLDFSPDHRKILENMAIFHCLQPPASLRHPSLNPEIRPPNDALGRYLRSISLTAMRQEMHRTCQARILLGGKLTGYSGRCPGILEEAWLALQAGIPLFVLGGFGGCTARIAQALLGETPEEFSEIYQVEQANKAHQAKQTSASTSPLQKPPATSTLQELLATYRTEREKGDPLAEVFDYQKVLHTLKEKGPAGLNNGLLKEENERLFATPYLAEMIQLVIKGLQQCATPSTNTPPTGQ